MPDDKIYTIIADDEALARKVIHKYLAPFPQVEVIAECVNGLEALNKVNELRPHLLFLDIEMPEIDGLSMLSELRYFPMIVFTTAFNQYAIKAFEMNAVDYLLKPFDQNRFTQALKKVIDQKSSPAFLENRINNLQNTINNLLRPEKNYASRIWMKEKNTWFFAEAEDIYWFEAFGDYVRVHTKDKTFLKNISLTELELKLNPHHFVRIHRSTIVNLSFIKEMKPYFNGEYHLELTNGTKLKLSRTYKDKLNNIIE